MATIAFWKGPVPGREAEALMNSQEVNDYHGKLVADGTIDSVQWFMGTSGPNITVIVGDQDKLLAVMEEPEWKRLTAKLQILDVQFDAGLYRTADSAEDAMNTYVGALKELGYV